MTFRPPCREIRRFIRIIKKHIYESTINIIAYRNDNTCGGYRRRYGVCRGCNLFLPLLRQGRNQCMEQIYRRYIMTLTDDDYRELAAQCAVQDFGRVERNDEMVHVRVDTYVEYDQHELSLTGGHIPVYAEVYVTNVFCDEDTEVDTARIEEETYELLMQY